MRFFEKLARKNLYVYYISRSLHEYFLSNFFFEAECEFFKKLKKKNNLKIIDIGASNGVFSNYISKYFYNSKFYCFEPLYYFHKQIKINKNKNRSFLIKKGCGDKPQKIIIYTPYVKILNLRIYFKFYSSINLNFLKQNLKYAFGKKNFLYKKSVIKTVKLDNFKLDADIIKIDAENYELKIILGAINTIKKNKPIIYIENPSKEIHKILKKINYEKYQYILETKKLKKITTNNKYSYNYFYIHNKNSLKNLLHS